MMPELDLIQIGSIIRKVRKGKGLRLEDLADENISPATVSNIERGVPHVNAEKVMYLLKKLGLSLEQIPELLVGEDEKAEHLYLQLFSLESQIGYVDTQQILQVLNKIEVEDDHPYAPYIHYIRGRCLIQQSQFSKAERSLFNAIRLSSRGLNKKRNFEALSFNELGICYYHQGDLNQALHFTESAADAYEENGERPQLKFTIALNQATYLEKMGRLGEAMQIVQNMWEHIDRMEISPALHLYELQSNLLKRMKVYDQAIKFAKDGIEKARLNGKVDFLFNFWTILGNIYLYKKDWEKAETCLLTALNLENYSSINVLVPAYTMLGLVYINKQASQKAEEILNKAVNLSEKATITPRFFALLVMADHLRKQERIEESIHFYNKALELTRNCRNKVLEYKVLFRLTSLKKDQNKEEFVYYLENMYEVAVTLEGHSEEEEYHEIL
jgi:tetratricopeptide (TPR) repeat protein